MNFITFKFSIQDIKISRFDLTAIYETFSRTFLKEKYRNPFWGSFKNFISHSYVIAKFPTWGYKLQPALV